MTGWLVPLAGIMFVGGVQADDRQQGNGVCSPAGIWSADHATVTVVPSAAVAGCPDSPAAPLGRFEASTVKYWKNDSLCLYPDGTLWYEQRNMNDTGLFGWKKAPAHRCDSILWHVGSTTKNSAEWCRIGTYACPAPRPPPPPPPPPSPWHVYAVPSTGVNFSTGNAALAAMFARGEALAAGNVRSFRATAIPGQPVEVMVEGAGYSSAWIETQPMAGAMYAHRNVRVALNNQLIFMRSARSDGFMAHRVDANPAGQSLKPDYRSSPGIQGLYFASPAVDVAFFLNLTGTTGLTGLANGTNATAMPSAASTLGRGGTTSDDDAAAYLDELQTSLERYDGWLWSSRNDSTCCSLHSTDPDPHCCPAVPSPGSRAGLLWSSGVRDTGEDGSDKFANATTPVQSMDMMGYSHDARRALARIAALQGDADGAARWTAAAATVAVTLKAELWRSDLGAAFDKDLHGDWVTTLVHNNVRAMWHGVFDQGMADSFVSRHLMNRSEFWTTMPLVSIAISDRRFQNKDGNNWSGPPEGLTVQRAIRALESYHHHAELVLLGLALTDALLPRQRNGISVGGNFPQQIHPFTAVPQPGDGYGPMILSLLEHTALRVGVVPRPGRGMLWSCHHHDSGGGGGGGGGGDGGGDGASSFTQVLGQNAFTLTLTADGKCSGTHGTTTLFNATGTLRVVTDFAGAVIEVWGIGTTTATVEVALPNPGYNPILDPAAAALMPPLSIMLAPNDEWAVAMGDVGSVAAGAGLAIQYQAPVATIIRKTPFYPPY